VLVVKEIFGKGIVVRLPLLKALSKLYKGLLELLLLHLEFLLTDQAIFIVRLD
jgi:hypothetical protein